MTPFGRIVAVAAGGVALVVGLVIWIANKSTGSDEQKLN
jgi:hypothetical protein